MAPRQSRIHAIKDADVHLRFSEELTLRAEYFAPIEVMRQATSESARVIRMSRLNRHGKSGEVREGWRADLLLIEGDPFADISILENPDRALPVTIKDGRIVKNRLRAPK